jgi:hypothetical protein
MNRVCRTTSIARSRVADRSGCSGSGALSSQSPSIQHLTRRCRGGQYQHPMVPHPNASDSAAMEPTCHPRQSKFSAKSRLT